MKSTRFGVWGRWCGKKKRKSPVSETRVRQVFRKTTGEEQRRRGHNAASLKNNSFNHNASTMCEKKAKLRASLHSKHRYDEIRRSALDAQGCLLVSRGCSSVSLCSDIAREPPPPFRLLYSFAYNNVVAIVESV